MLLEPIDSVPAIVEIAFFCRARLIAESFPQEMLANVWPAVTLVIERNATPADLIDVHRHRWIKPSHDALNLFVGHLPDPEKPENVIDAVSIKISAQLLEARTPPCVTITAHDLPVVSRKSPVLSLHRKGIRRCPSLRVHLEQMRRRPRVHGLTINPDRQIPLQREPFGMQVRNRIRKLAIKLVLQPDVIGNLRPLGMRSDRESIDFFRIKYRPLAPMRKVRRAIVVALHAENRIGKHPVMVVLEEIFESCRRGDRLGVLFKYPLEQARLGRHHTFVIDLRKRIQLPTRVLELLRKIRRHGIAEVIKTQVNRVQGIDADRRIRIRIRPIMRRGGVVDRQNLNELETRL